MKVYVLSTYDKTSYGGDDRVVIQGVYLTKKAAEKVASNLILKSFEDYSVEEYDA